MRRAPLLALYVADSISLVGNVVAQLAIPWFVLVETGSPTLTGLAVFFNFLPVVLAGFFGGVIVDRLGFRTTSVVADLASAGAVAAIPLLHSTVGIELWQLMALVFVGALLDAPGATARLAMFPDLVELAGVGTERGKRDPQCDPAGLVPDRRPDRRSSGCGDRSDKHALARRCQLPRVGGARRQVHPAPGPPARDRGSRPLPRRAR
jgi:hypothetical protein